jgi:hypothetical protein
MLNCRDVPGQSVCKHAGWAARTKTSSLLVQGDYLVIESATACFQGTHMVHTATAPTTKRHHASPARAEARTHAACLSRLASSGRGALHHDGDRGVLYGAANLLLCAPARVPRRQAPAGRGGQGTMGLSLPIGASRTRRWPELVEALAHGRDGWFQIREERFWYRLIIYASSECIALASVFLREHVQWQVRGRVRACDSGPGPTSARGAARRGLCGLLCCVYADHLGAAARHQAWQPHSVRAAPLPASHERAVGASAG